MIDISTPNAMTTCQLARVRPLSRGREKASRTTAAIGRKARRRDGPTRSKISRRPRRRSWTDTIAAVTIATPTRVPEPLSADPIRPR